MSKRMKSGLVRVVKKLEIFRVLTEDEALHILGLCQRKAYDTGDAYGIRGIPASTCWC